jgi:hypothetical protein
MRDAFPLHLWLKGLHRATPADSELPDTIHRYWNNPETGVLERREFTREQLLAAVPKDVCYCMSCPFQDTMPQFGHQMDGYCHLICRGDWMDMDEGGTDLLWDGCKECGINTEMSPEEEEFIRKQMAMEERLAEEKPTEPVLTIVKVSIEPDPSSGNPVPKLTFGTPFNEELK